jgi:hypothetical protein
VQRSTRGKSKRARLTYDELRNLARLNPPPQAWYDETND